jgi:hypothetical protein
MKRLSKRRSRRRSGINRRKIKSVSRDKKHKNKKRFSKTKRNSRLQKILLGTAAGVGLIGAGLAIKNARNDYNQKVEYEENVLIPIDEHTHSKESIKFNDRVDFSIRSIDYPVKKTNTYNMYTTYKIEILKGRKQFSNLTDKVSKFPMISNNTKLPTYFVVNAQLIPLKGINYSFVIYYQIKPETIRIANEIENGDTKSELAPAIKLLTKFVSDYPKYRDRFKGVAALGNYDSLEIGWLGRTVISKFNKPEGRGTILDKTVTHPKSSNKIFELDVDINKFIIPSPLSKFIDKDKITEYYDKTHGLSLDIGFVIEGGPQKHGKTPRTVVENDLPEVLLGGTHIDGFEIVPANQDPEIYIVGQTVKIDEMEQLIDAKTLKMGDYYAYDYIEKILDDLKNKNYVPYEQLLLGLIKNDNRNKSDNKKFFMYARYFYYKNLHNSDFELKSDILSYSAGHNKFIARGTCFGNDRVFNFYQCTNGNLKTYRFGLSIKNSFDEFDFTKVVVEKINEFKSFFERHIPFYQKKLICICLLTPCNTSICKLIEKGSKTLPKEAYLSFMENKIVDVENKALNDLGDVFINLPLSSSKSGTLFNGGTKSIVSDSNNHIITSEFENLAKVSGSKDTFESIVNIARLYYKKYRNSHHLCYHCKSGKDRTSMCDAVVQATFYHIKENGYVEESEAMYNEIRELSKYFLLYGFIITFYSTGIPGIKMNNMPVAEYILGQKNGNLYKFFLGNSHLSSS